MAPKRKQEPEDIVAGEGELEKEEFEEEQVVEEDIPEMNQSGEDPSADEQLEEEPFEKLLEPFSKDQLTLLIKEALAKHPDLASIVHAMADSDPAHCKIFVHGLGWDANADSITSVFSKYGEIEDCKVVRDKNTGKSKGYGFILFKQRDGARRALKEPQKLIEGRMTCCQLASAGPVQTPVQSAPAIVASPPASEYTQRKIYVSNVSAELDPKKLFDYFSKFGEIEEGPLGLDKQTGKPRGFCLFVYKSSESAKKALEEPHKQYEGHILHCQKAIDGPKHSKGHFNNQQQGYHHHQAKRGRYAGHSGGHLMAPSAGPAVPSGGFGPAVAPAAIGQAVAALLATQGAGLGIGNLLGGIGNAQGVHPMMNNAGFGGPGAGGGYGGQPGMHGGYGGQPQMGPGGVRPHQGGAPYMGHGH
ncbi:UBP1-associated protein 2A-like [Salvia hispanica]|uniref:UBP1-associated protein 2A-like n=1 Tax=Salvia hispanica TaxID=49212 RepID=UPI0020094B2F|nr:UBP1-associated protein 2A-like [Salvia hispanica]XP_047979626.1 UBP1-associated protein 2A-like [Salvia hispanica]XP_047979627.1 UBP1-associated protein 2A-like [Salvia hispanica]XP_047979628.1 UBP1-associated protein 2A-like [Salvia hispanica]XP_047979629.1 UBP1-associated protein 2A-like [Salvia hispanica]XP_047979631.1 UBP1-associated protein 2A-like [Salvia hispanica]XP_047979632.1 UBP1-associated protein 2A-like [Salvia hispanica]